MHACPYKIPYKAKGRYMPLLCIQPTIITDWLMNKQLNQLKQLSQIIVAIELKWRRLIHNCEEDN